MILCLKNHEIITDVSVSNYLARAGNPTHEAWNPLPTVAEHEHGAHTTPASERRPAPRSCGSD